MPTSRRNREVREAEGKARLKHVPHAKIARYNPWVDRPHVVDAIRADEVGRIKKQLPKRHKKMCENAFRFLRATAGIMAADLVHQPNSGIDVLSAGDCHLGNFGVFGSTDGSRAIFDMNDFDEADIAPFEWDVKRLATSFVLERTIKDGHSAEAKELARRTAHAYAKAMLKYATKNPAKTWRARIDLVGGLRHEVKDGEVRKALKNQYKRARKKSVHGYAELLSEQKFDDDQESLQRLTAAQRRLATVIFESYVQQTRTNAPERAVLLDRYRLADVVFKVAGTGSLGRFCALGLFLTEDDEPLVLQAKQAMDSVLAVHAAQRSWHGHSQRVVVSQRILQVITDPFLDWTQEPIERNHFYIRQLKDSRLSGLDEDLAEADHDFHATLCGMALARAHARAGDPACIAGYIGEGDSFVAAITAFALAYADQVRQDHKVFCHSAYAKT